ncbi:hypothetical protein O6H91_11G044200 [Diphasiastrum complanatum]|uniref:Uncharacterized protein n=1 Tax=Diphasiastrum complanatum TaxID=34168 RepID=A0ACC2C8I3_DIPCM|nr:hypothetical protein O6H91_11G044200 [Diphasiastrum complanatum]
MAVSLFLSGFLSFTLCNLYENSGLRSLYKHSVTLCLMHEGRPSRLKGTRQFLCYAFVAARSGILRCLFLQRNGQALLLTFVNRSMTQCKTQSHFVIHTYSNINTQDEVKYTSVLVVRSHSVEREAQSLFVLVHHFLSRACGAKHYPAIC